MLQPGRRFLGLSTLLVLGILLLPQLSSAQVASQDPNFTPSVHKSGLSEPSGLVFRSPTGDLVVPQNAANQISLVNASSGGTKSFAAQTFPQDVAVRANDGLVAVRTQVVAGQASGPIDFYSSTGTLLGSIAVNQLPAACVSGLVFDSNGNLYVAAGPALEGGSCDSNGWALYEFAQGEGQTPSTSSSQVVTFFAGDLIGGLAFAAAPLPSGTLYAISSSNGNVYEISVACFDCGANQIAQVTTGGDSPVVTPSGIAVDPLSGDIYISEFSGTSILRMPPPCVECDPGTPSTFATGFSNTLGLAFDTTGNLYVNETNTGKLWKFTRNSFATALQQILQGQTLTFTNPNPAMSDQTQTIFIPQSANLCDTSGRCAAFIQAIFVPVQKATFDLRLEQGSFGDPDFFGGGPVPPGTKCVPIPSASPNAASPNCVNVVQKCYDASHKPYDICPVHEPSGNTDLIQLTFKWTDPSFVAGPNTAFLIDFDTATDTGTLTNITDMTDPGGGTRSLCSVTMTALLGTATNDFSLGPILPVTIGSPATVPVNSLPVGSPTGFSSPVTLSVSDVPPGVTATLNQLSVTPLPGIPDSTTTLTVSLGPTFGSANTPAGIATVIANLLASGCIDNSGIANALTGKLSAAQAALNGGQIQTAINTLGAFQSQVQAQSGKHISNSCTTTFTLIVTGTSLGEVHLASANVSATSTNAAGILAADASSAITKLAGANTADPIVGTVSNAPMGTVVTINGPSTMLSTMTDGTGFYYFANTGLVKGVSYTIKAPAPLPAGFNGVTPTSQIFTWGGKGLVFNFTLF
jgi:FIMAH domain-containing protein